MSIPISDIINVSIAVAPNAVATDGFGPMLFMSKEFVPVSGEVPVQSFTSLKEVQDRFPNGAEIQAAATAYYSQKPQPKTFIVGAITQTTTTPASAASVSATTAAVLSEIKLITGGGLSFVVSGQTVNVTGIDLSGVADFDAAVTLLNTKIKVETDKITVGGNYGIVVSQATGKFKFTTAATGAVATLSIPTGTVATTLKLVTANNPTVVAGKDAQSIEIDLNNALNSKLWFFYVCVERSLRATAQQMSAAKWSQANGKVFGWADSNADILKLSTTNSFKEAKDAQLQNTICVFDASPAANEYPEVSVLGRAATVNFNVANSVIVLAFKKGPTITTADLTSGQLKALRSYNGNAFISVEENSMFLDGKMADGTWFDTVQGVEWLTQKVRNNVFNLFYQSTTKIPWTDTGVAMVNQQITNALELARTNGLIAPGFDNEGNFYPDGYKVMSTPLELLQSQKGARIWEGSSFIAIGSGALQGAEISGTFIQ